ncbi:hypothetical protein [Rurimicrobium arvi]|uniref:Lipocalin-like domain-containing protein n=1 Tax=Rurimicrobium arvi TaxID=2049916 RepID=A0ABP8MS32_9BACT
MKKNYVMLALMALSLFSACKKDDKKSSSSSGSASANLIGKKWKLTAYRYNYSGVDVDGYSTLSDCARDNYSEFKSGDVVTAYEGATKCDASSPDSQSGKWKLQSSDTEILLTDFTAVYGVSSLVMKIVILNSTTLKVTYTTTVGGPTIFNTATYTAM